jgi:molecular chaperone HscB
VDEHFCSQCSRILALGRHGDYFTFLGLPRLLTVDARDLERRFRELSRKFHPDFFYNAAASERLASLERSSYLNDAYRVLRNVVSRIEYLLSLEGFSPATSEASGAAGASRMPPSLLEEVFALNEELDEIRELRESGFDAAQLRMRLDEARTPIDRKREAHEQELHALSARWVAQADAPAADRRATLEALRARLLERHYIINLLATIEREAVSLDPDRSPAPPARDAEPNAHG